MNMAAHLDVGPDLFRRHDNILAKHTAHMHDTESSIYSLTSNSRLLKLKEFISNESDDQAGFSDGRIAQKDKFEVAYSAVAHGVYLLLLIIVVSAAAVVCCVVLVAGWCRCRLSM